MDDELKQKILERLEGIENRLTQLERDQNLLRKANARARAILPKHMAASADVDVRAVFAPFARPGGLSPGAGIAN